MSIAPVNDKPTAAEQRYTTDSVLQRGTTISYRQLGHGPGLCCYTARWSRPRAICSSPRRWLLTTQTLHYDFELVAETDGKLESYGAIGAEVLLLSGSKSPAYLRGAVDALEKVLPDAKRVEFAGLGHGASGNTDRGGKPERVAQELRQFFV